MSGDSEKALKHRPSHPHSNLLLTPEQYIDNVHLCFSLGPSQCLHDEHTACGCGVHPGQFSPVQEFFDHILGCKKGAKGTITQRHDLILPLSRRLASSGTHPARAVASPELLSQLCQTRARAASKGTRKLILKKLFSSMV